MFYKRVLICYSLCPKNGFKVDDWNFPLPPVGSCGGGAPITSNWGITARTFRPALALFTSKTYWQFWPTLGAVQPVVQSDCCIPEHPRLWAGKLSPTSGPPKSARCTLEFRPIKGWGDTAVNRGHSSLLPLLPL